MKKILFFLFLLSSVISVFCETNVQKITSYNFDIVKDDVSANKQIFYNISYTPHKNITPISLYIISRSELSFTDNHLAALFEYLDTDDYYYRSTDVLKTLDLLEDDFEVIDLRRGKTKNKYLFIKEK